MAMALTFVLMKRTSTLKLLIISGSPSASSRSSKLARVAAEHLSGRVSSVSELSVRDLPSEALLSANTRHPAVQHAIAQVLQADVIIFSTPIYKGAYSGLLKTFVDLLRGKTLLPVATGGSPAHLLALDYAVRPLLAALGARVVLDSVYAHDAQLQTDADGHERWHPDILDRIDKAWQPWLDLSWRTALPSPVAPVTPNAHPVSLCP
jgi:FMN reductase